MDIYLAKSDGGREGPYSLEQVNRDLTARKYNDSDYWAWYEGLEGWVPLYSIPGIVQSSHDKVPSLAAVAEAEDHGRAAEVQPSEAAPAASVAATAEPEPAVPEATAAFSGMPFAALEQIFIFTSGEGPSATQSMVTAQMLQESIGADLEKIRATVPRDVFGRCKIGEQLRRDSRIPKSAWQAMAALKPDIVREAQEGAYRTCVRTFVTESGDTVAVFLFYNKQKI